MILKSLLNFLDNKSIKYETIEHKTTYTALDSSETQHIKPDEVVKTLVVKIDNKFALALVSAKCNLDKNKLKKTVNVARKKLKEKATKKVDFAKEAWMKKNIQGKVGATPPFGELLKIQTFIDGKLLSQKSLYINTGDYNFSLKLTGAAFKKAIGGEFEKGSFSVAKKIKKQPKSKKKKAKKSTRKKPAKKKPIKRKTKTKPKKKTLKRKK